MTLRRFQLHTHMTLPLELHAAPGAVHKRGEPGEILEIDADRCRVHDRFLRGRIRAGDLTELELEPEAELLTPPPAEPAQPELAPVLAAMPALAPAPLPAIAAAPERAE